MKVLITGATSGIGEALAKRYAQQHDVIACGRDEQKLKELEDSQGQGRIKGLSFDVTELEAVKNYYFDAEIKIDELFFDYKLKKGVCQNMNASFLLKKMEIV